jgi:hypothetical protein
MGIHDYISETEAAHQAGVSVKTLRRFSDAGYLQVEIEPDGLRLYSQRELDEIFGAHRRGSTESFQSDSSNGSEDASLPREEAACEVVAPTHQEAPPPSQTCEAAVGESCATTEQINLEQKPAQRGAISDQSDGSTEAIDTSIYAIEVLKLRNVISLQEKLLDTKDAEIADLKGQRDWLRARIEKLEEKSDRDQILLLSETQTIRKLISLQEQRRSPMNRILEWLGINPQPTVKALGGTSEYANSDTIATSDRTLVKVASASNE